MLKHEIVFWPPNIKPKIFQIKDGKKQLDVVNDKLGTPTYTFDFAKNVKLVLEKELWGVYNLVCQGLTSRYEVSNEILKHFNLSSKITLNSVNSSFFKKDYFVERPKSERLINKKLNLRSLNKMRDWKECLHEYLDINFKDFLNKNII